MCVPSEGGASFPAPGVSFCYGVERVAHKFTTITLGYLFRFIGSRTSHALSPMQVNLYDACEELSFTYFLRRPS